MTEAPRRYRLPRSHRLRSREAFTAVIDARASRRVGPLIVHGRPNELAHPRLGVRVARRVGNSPARNRIKRLLREAFRLSQHDWPRGYDVVVSVRPHEPATLADYQRLLFAAIRDLHRHWEKRLKKLDDRPPPS